MHKQKPTTKALPDIAQPDVDVFSFGYNVAVNSDEAALNTMQGGQEQVQAEELALQGRASRLNKLKPLDLRLLYMTHRVNGTITDVAETKSF